MVRLLSCNSKHASVLVAVLSQGGGKGGGGDDVRPDPLRTVYSLIMLPIKLKIKQNGSMDYE